MKIEVDLSELLFDEDYGPETLNDSVRRQVVESIKREYTEKVKKQVDKEVTEEINKIIVSQVAEMAPQIIKDILDCEYHVVNTWGERQKETTSFRNELIKELKSQMVYKKDRYNSDKNLFTESIDKVICENLKVFEKEYTKNVDCNLRKEAFRYAVATLNEKLDLRLSNSEINQ